MEKGAVIVTSIRVRAEVWQALRALAEARSLAFGGKPSISAAVEHLVEADTVRREGPRAS